MFVYAPDVTAGGAGDALRCARSAADGLQRPWPGLPLISYALFDTAGEVPPGRWPAGRDAPIGEDILREAEDYGLRVRPTP